MDEQGRSKKEWQSFTIAQQVMEQWASMPRSSALLDENDSGNQAAGTEADGTCAGIPDGDRHYRADELGNKVTTGPYEVCVKITSGSPEPGLVNVRVVVVYTDNNTGSRHVLLQTAR